jgi:23S rRNA pseudouridine2605 synthase
VSGTPDERALARLRRVIRLDDGPTGPVQVTVEKRLPTKTWLQITVHEGRNHLVRRLCEAISHRAEKLQRIALGPLELGKLPLGDFRPLTPRELTALRRLASAARRTPAPPPPRRLRRTTRPTSP